MSSSAAAQGDTPTDALEDIFSISEDLVQSRTSQPPSTGTIDFDGLLPTPLKIHQDLRNGVGGMIWPAGEVLTKYLLRCKRDEVKDRSIIELGAGGGLVGLAVALGCQPGGILHITDQQPMLELMAQNIHLNGVSDRVQAEVYDWGSSRPEAIPAHPDVILAADCVYFEPAFPLLLQTLSDLIGPNTVCYFCFKRRRRADMHFVKALKKQFLVEPVLDDPDREVYARENISLCVIRSRDGQRRGGDEGLKGSLGLSSSVVPEPSL